MNGVARQTIHELLAGNMRIVTLHTGWNPAMDVMTGITSLLSMHAWEFYELGIRVSMARSTVSNQIVIHSNF